MLKAYVSIRSGKDISGLKKRGDIIVVKLAELPHSQREQKEFLIIEDWKDDDLEKEMRLNSETVKVHPYAVYDVNGNMTVRSNVFVNFTQFSTTVQNQYLNKNLIKAPRKLTGLVISRR